MLGLHYVYFSVSIICWNLSYLDALYIILIIH